MRWVTGFGEGLQKSRAFAAELQVASCSSDATRLAGEDSRLFFPLGNPRGAICPLSSSVSLKAIDCAERASSFEPGGRMFEEVIVLLSLALRRIPGRSFGCAATRGRCRWKAKKLSGWLVVCARPTPACSGCCQDRFTNARAPHLPQKLFVCDHVASALPTY